MKPLAVLLVAGLSLSIATAAPPRQQPPPARDARATVRADSGTIRGRIVSAETGEPLRHARVEVNAPELKAVRAVPSDLEGRFEFQHLPQGRYVVRASKNGYVALSYGQRRPFQSGRRIDLAPGQVFEDARIALPRGAVIAGRVVDDVGEPVAGIRVGAYRLRFLDGRRQVVTAGQPAQTDDLGQYRVSALAPGTYFVGTRGGVSASGTMVEEGVTLATTYHPATANFAEARPVTVRPAQDVRNIDIAMVVGRAASVSGVVVDSRGRPPAGLVVTAKPAGDSLLALLNTVYGTVQANGRFAVRNLMPGEYVLHASVRTSDSKDAESADVPLSIGGVDQEGMTVASLPNGRIVGRVVFDGEARPSFAPGSLRLTAAATMSNPPASAQVGAGWDFEIRNVEPGRVAVAFDSLPAGWALKRTVADGRDVTESLVEVKASEAVSLELTLTDKPTRISGIVKADGANTVPSDYTVVLFGADPAQWGEGSKRILVARPDQNGTYAFTGVPPGNYRAIALEYLDDGEQWNPEFLAWARSRSKAVVLEDGASISLDLPLTKYGS